MKIKNLVVVLHLRLKLKFKSISVHNDDINGNTKTGRVLVVQKNCKLFYSILRDQADCWIEGDVSVKPAGAIRSSPPSGVFTVYCKRIHCTLQLSVRLLACELDH